MEGSADGGAEAEDAAKRQTPKTPSAHLRLYSDSAGFLNEMVPQAGLEPVTFCSGGRRSIR